MILNKIKKHGYLFAAMLLFFVLPNFTYAMHAAISIRDSSIKWNDRERREKLLDMAPAWDRSTIHAMFKEYRDGAHNQLPATTNAIQYNVEFINSMWGPVNNPFVKYARPAKVFVLFNNSDEYLMAPLIKDKTDANYYIFDKSQSRPVLLNDWLTDIMTTHANSELRFNVCNGYANSLNDSCQTKCYQEEVEDAYDMSSQLHHQSNKQVQRSHSARRLINESWRNNVATLPLRAHGSYTSIFDSSVEWGDDTAKNNLLNTVVSWSNYKIIQDNFSKIRDIRYFDDNRVNGFMRRISWLYPDDGCWTRATAVIKDLFGVHGNVVNHYSRPSKIFAFGDLCVNTNNSPDGYVAWWYHTAPVIKDAATKKIYVLDPAVDPRKPLTVERWMEAIATNSGPCKTGNAVKKFAICNGYGTMPTSKCDTTYRTEEFEDIRQPDFQEDERWRQIDLGRNPDEVLGDSPPWIN